MGCVSKTVNLEMVSNWEEEKRPAENHLAENNDERPGGIGSKAQDKVEW